MIAAIVLVNTPSSNTVTFRLVKPSIRTIEGVTISFSTSVLLGEMEIAVTPCLAIRKVPSENSPSLRSEVSDIKRFPPDTLLILSAAIGRSSFSLSLSIESRMIGNIKDIPLARINFKDDVHLGYVSYMPTYLNKKTVYENFKYVLKQRKVPKDEIEQRINDVLIEYNLEKYKNTKVNTLSLYEKHAISIIRLALRPLEVALVDNIFNNIDEEQTEHLVSLIKSVFLDKNVTTLIATENEDIAKMFSDKIIKFENGSIVKE